MTQKRWGWLSEPSCLFFAHHLFTNSILVREGRRPQRAHGQGEQGQRGERVDQQVSEERRPVRPFVSTAEKLIALIPIQWLV